MTNVYPTRPRLSVRDSFDDDDLSDVDDEVFIRDGKNGSLKLDDEGGVKRPLMAPRRKMKTHKINHSQRLPYRALLGPFCYGLLALLILLGLITACIFTVNLFPVPFNILKNWMTKSPEKTINVFKVEPCTSLASFVVWTRTLPKFTSEAPLRSTDVNGDKVEDIIVGFSTGLDAADAPEYLCDLYFDGQTPCLGGIMALDGKTGETLWIHWTPRGVFNVDCGQDITTDNVNDCIITGRGGIFHAVDGRDGTSIWKFESRASVVSSRDDSVLEVYDAAFMSDVDNDKIDDIIATYTLQSGELRSSEILVISGKTGNTIRSVIFPRKEELFIAPRTLVHPDGETMLVLVSTTSDKSGGLYIISYSELMHGNLEFRELYCGKGKGIMLPPIITDITLDGTEDIIVATVNASIIAFDGLSLKPIWNYTLPGSEIISIPVPGYYNDDNVPDFMVKHHIGPGYPVYYYTLSTILDGRNGTPLLEKPITDSVSGQMSGLSISVDDYGNDWFLHWSSDCLNHEGARDKYRFLQGQSLLSQSKADLCRLRFNTTIVTRLWALSQHVGPPGQSLYCSEDWKAVEYNNSIDPRGEAEKYLRDHPNLDGLDGLLDAGLTLVSERSPRVEKPYRKISSFRHKDADKDVANPEHYYGKDVIDAPEIVLDDSSQFGNNPPAADGYDIPYKDTKNFDFNSDIKSDEGNWVDSNDWQDEEIPGDKQYDMMYEDAEDALAENSRTADIRQQRSDNTDQEKPVVNGSESSRNQYDVDMDYTNGGSKYINFPPPPPSLQPDNSMFGNVGTDEEQRTQKKRRKRPGAIAKFSDDKEYANIERIFKRESMRNYLKTEKTSRIEYTKNQKRKRRDSDDTSNVSKGIQRQPPTGIILPSITKSEGKTSIDLIYSTYWLPPSEISLVLLQQDLDCIRVKRTKNLKSYSNEDIIAECLAERGVDYKIYQEGTSRENVKIPLGQMTVYRIKLECVCPDDLLPGQSCKNISQHQSWPAHMGASANGFFRPLKGPKN